ncbi:MAG TPA: FxSxx-COOH system tetratricopeptide repeat protein [Actinophytocola sp.]|uniref:FxSxx-COOH system tetratricopeptide repeat protein n=1 Tax=Actinophytocola sp. TaxID=1872138 RepID=UPI002DDCC4E1|nr:FxSxx-COOH system tetratricopeptide repeat protein [Actinophytocola sp.]HEV2783688.1 FxSxx-COOH system tetratricopeptide repeat protein [Actinophytocola sp.]
MSTTRALGDPAKGRVVACLSATGGTGCTSTVANLAWLLSGAGRRILVVDWGSDVPRVREYLEPFFTGRQTLPADLAGSLLAAHGLPATPADDRAPSADRFAPPEADGYIDVAAEADEDGLAPPLRGLSYAGGIADLRAQLVGAAYDHVLIDVPTGPDEQFIALIAALCDTALVCFRPRPRAIADAAEIAAQLRRAAPVRIDLVPVATFFDDGIRARAERIRDAIHTAFADPLAGQALRVPGGAIEIPNRPYDTFDPLLPLVVEEPRDDDQLQIGYGRLAAAVTHGAITKPAPVSDELRSRYRRAFDLEAKADPDRILVAYTPHDRPWADWVRGRLERSGALTRPFTVDSPWLGAARPPGLVIVSSAQFEDSPERADVVDAVHRASAAGRPLSVLGLAVDAETATAQQYPTIAVGEIAEEDLAAGEQQLAAQVLSHFGLVDRPMTEPARPLRLPGGHPPIFGVPPRHPRFVGRDRELEELRDQLSHTADRRVTVTVNGVQGVGKSELALEYAYRFAGDYDLVWWVPAGDEQSAMVSLARLTARLQPSGPHGFGTTAGLERLATDQKLRRFLLIYDNVEDPAALAELLPGGDRGHLIITSNEARPDAFLLEPMTPLDSRRLLSARVPGLTREDALRIAAAVDHLPIALELTAAWLAETAATDRRAGSSVADAATWAVRAFLNRLEGESDPKTINRVVSVVVQTMRETPSGRMTVLLAQLAAFLSEEGVSLDLVRSTAMLDQLVALGGQDAQPLAVHAGEIDRILWVGARYGLFRVDWGTQSSLRLHRIVQAALRTAMTPAESAERRDNVLAALAKFAPTEVERTAPYYVARCVELQKHIYPSGALDSQDDSVRRWQVNQVRFLYDRGGPGVHQASVGPIEKLLDDWTSRHGAGDPLRLRLASQLANLHRALGNRHQALRLDDDVLAWRRRSLPLNHPQALVSARGRAGDLRGLGLFADALDEDQAVWSGLREEFGDDHPQTRMAALNLALSLYLSGDVRQALTVALDAYRRRKRLLGEDHERTLYSLTRVAVYRRELGDLQGAQADLRTAWGRLFRQDPGVTTLGLDVRWQQAITLRCMGYGKPAMDRNGKVLSGYRELLGEDHPDTLACTLSFAAAIRAVGAEPGFAVENARHALDRFLSVVRLDARHPFIALCQLGLGLAECAAGRDGSPHTGAALETLRSRLGEGHPWTLAAAVDHARLCAASGSAGQAEELIRAARDNCLEFLGAAHPYTTIAEHNLRQAVAPTDQRWSEIDVDIPQT